jgi:hypothetical protein
MAQKDRLLTCLKSNVERTSHQISPEVSFRCCPERALVNAEHLDAIAKRFA